MGADEVGTSLGAFLVPTLLLSRCVRPKPLEERRLWRELGEVD